MTAHYRPRARRRSAMLLMELMISLAISAMLLVAIGAAYQASSSAITINEDFFQASQAARVSLNQILSLARRAEAFQPTGYDNISNSWTGSSLLMTYHAPGADANPSTDPSCIYRWTGGPTDELQLYQNGVTYSMARNVTAFSFTADMAQLDPLSPQKALVRVTVDMTVTVGNQSVRLTGSAVPRATVVYK